jgi:hypothetical protein
MRVHCLHYTTNVICVTKLTITRLTGHVARVGKEDRCLYVFGGKT